MSGESVPLALPLARLSTGTCEATTLYHELRKPLLRDAEENRLARRKSRFSE